MAALQLYGRERDHTDEAERAEVDTPAAEPAQFAIQIGEVFGDLLREWRHECRRLRKLKKLLCLGERHQCGEVDRRFEQHAARDRIGHNPFNARALHKFFFNAGEVNRVAALCANPQAQTPRAVVSNLGVRQHSSFARGSGTRLGARLGRNVRHRHHCLRRHHGLRGVFLLDLGLGLGDYVLHHLAQFGDGLAAFFIDNDAALDQRLGEWFCGARHHRQGDRDEHRRHDSDSEYGNDVTFENVLHSHSCSPLKPHRVTAQCKFSMELRYENYTHLRMKLLLQIDETDGGYR